jgi:hypothetical protein
MPEAAQVTEVQAPPPPAAPAAAPSAPAPAESASATPEGTEQKPVTPDPAEKRGNSRFERRISRLVREAAEARAERDLYRRQLDEAKPKEQSDPGEPKLEQFKDIEEYATAKAKYAGEKALKSHQEKQTTAQYQERVKELTSTWEARVSDAEDKYDDFEQVVGVIKPDSVFGHALMEAENGPEIAYYLGKNVAEAKRILKLHPLAQARAIGRLEAKLAAEPPKPQTPSRAPAPITPLTGAASTASSTPSEEDDMRTWFRKRQQQVHGKRK